MRKYNPTPEQKAKSEERRAKLRAMAKAVSEMSAEERMEIVARIGAVPTCEGRPLSIYNTCFLMAQFETVSVVGGFQQWKSAAWSMND